MAALGKRPPGKPNWGRISETGGGLKSVSVIEAELIKGEMRKREIRVKPRWEFGVFAIGDGFPEVLDSDCLGGKERWSLWV